MLRVKNIIDIVPIKVTIDEYIPLKVIFGEWNSSLEPTVYWQSGDLKKNLIEVGFGEKKGVIRFITLVLIKNITKNKMKISCDKYSLGIPVFERNFFDKSFLLEEKGQLEMIMDGDNIYILLSGSEIDSKIICDRVTFFLNKDKFFCGFEVSNITDKEMNTLKENFINRLYG